MIAAQLFMTPLPLPKSESLLRCLCVISSGASLG